MQRITLFLSLFVVCFAAVWVGTTCFLVARWRSRCQHFGSIGSARAPAVDDRFTNAP